MEVVCLCLCAACLLWTAAARVHSRTQLQCRSRTSWDESVAVRVNTESPSSPAQVDKCPHLHLVPPSVPPGLSLLWYQVILHFSCSHTSEILLQKVVFYELNQYICSRLWRFSLFCSSSSPLLHLSDPCLVWVPPGWSPLSHLPSASRWLSLPPCCFSSLHQLQPKVGPPPSV